MPILPATTADIPQLLALANSAFRGETSKKGWTHEADLIAGEARTDTVMLRDMILHPDGTMFKVENETGQIEACVYLQLKTRGLYLGMLTVSPELQGAGTGKKLLAAAEDYAREHHCPVIYMTVISRRAELIDWYERHGYRLTGETEPFAVDTKYGVPMRPLEFAILEKVLAPVAD